jgi:hypothetical protein
MKSVTKKRTDPPMRKEYDFSGGVVGKYAKQRTDSPNVVLLDPDVAGTFPDSKSVNDALRTLIKIAQPRKSRR